MTEKTAQQINRMKEQTIGVEIKMNNITHKAAAKLAADFFGTSRTEYTAHRKGSKTGAYLTIEPKDGGLVPVAVWEVTADDEKHLDIYEGYPNFYYKKEVRLPIRLANGKTKKVTAFVYIMHEEREIAIPSMTYIRTCEEGYRNFGFDLKYLDRAYMRSTKED